MLFGGISIYLEQYLAMFRHTPRVLDRLWDSPRVIDGMHLDEHHEMPASAIPDAFAIVCPAYPKNARTAGFSSAVFE